MSLKMRHENFTVVYTSQYPYFKLVQFNTRKIIFTDKDYNYTVCPESSDPSEKLFNIFASENEVYTIH